MTPRTRGFTSSTHGKPSLRVSAPGMPPDPSRPSTPLTPTLGEASPALAVPAAPSPIHAPGQQLSAAFRRLPGRLVPVCRHRGKVPPGTIPGDKGPLTLLPPAQGESEAAHHPVTAANTTRAKIHRCGVTQQHRPAQEPLPCRPRLCRGGDCRSIKTTTVETTTVVPTKLETTIAEIAAVQTTVVETTTVENTTAETVTVQRSPPSWSRPWWSPWLRPAEWRLPRWSRPWWSSRSRPPRWRPPHLRPFGQRPPRCHATHAIRPPVPPQPAPAHPSALPTTLAFPAAPCPHFPNICPSAFKRKNSDSSQMPPASLPAHPERPGQGLMLPAVTHCPRCSRRAPRHLGLRGQEGITPASRGGGPQTAFTPHSPHPGAEPPGADASHDKPPLQRRAWKSPQRRRPPVPVHPVLGCIPIPPPCPH